MSYAAAFPASDPPRRTPFESAFIRTVLEHRGAGYRPTQPEFSRALEVLQRYLEQRLDDPPDDDSWEPRLDEEDQAALRARAFLMFGDTRPTPAQWHKAYLALFGPLLCETC